MHIRRVHCVNSVIAAIPLATEVVQLRKLANSLIRRATSSLRGARVGALLLISSAICSSTLFAQQETELLNRSAQTFPNPFRTGPVTNEKTVAEPTNGNLRSAPTAHWVDVIRLESLPSHIEPPVVTAMSVSPKGDVIAAAGDDHAIRIVDLATGKTTATLIGHLDWVQSVEFSPSGLELASCGNDGTLRVWSIGSTPKMISTKSVPHALMTLTFLSDDCIFAAGFSNRIYRYDCDQKDLVIFHSCDCRDIRAIAVSPDRKWIAFGGRDGVLRMRRINIVENESGLHPQPSNDLMVPLHFKRIRSLQFSSDGNQLTTVGEDRRIIHYDFANRAIGRQAEIGGGKLLGLCELEPHLFAIASSDNTIRIFSDIDQQVHATLMGHDGSVSVLKRTQKHLISGSYDTTIRIWDIDRAIAMIDKEGNYHHPVAAQFEDSGAGEEVK